MTVEETPLDCPSSLFFLPPFLAYFFFFFFILFFFPHCPVTMPTLEGVQEPLFALMGVAKLSERGSKWKVSALRGARQVQPPSGISLSATFCRAGFRRFRWCFRPKTWQLPTLWGTGGILREKNNGTSYSASLPQLRVFGPCPCT